MKEQEKRFTICHPSGTVLFKTNDKFIADNRKKFGWKVIDRYVFHPDGR